MVAFGTAAPGGKAAAYVELNKIVQGLARRQSWKQLDERAVTKIVTKVYSALGMRLAQRKLAQAVPVVGVIVGAGLNARLLARVVDDADHAYRERFLREKYRTGTAHDVSSTGGQDAVVIIDIIDAEIVETGDQ